MYGLLLKNLQDYIVDKFGQKKWDSVKVALKLEEVHNLKRIAFLHWDFCQENKECTQFFRLNEILHVPLCKQHALRLKVAKSQTVLSFSSSKNARNYFLSTFP